jgi:hypothetical protein
MREDQRAQQAALIEDELYHNVFNLVQYLYPGALYYKGYFYPAAKSKEDKGSFQIAAEGPDAGKWVRFSQGVGGGPLQLISYAFTGSTKLDRKTFDVARGFLGYPDPDAQTAYRTSHRLVQPVPDVAGMPDPSDEKGRLRAATAIWEASRPIASTPAHLYLMNRKIKLRSLPDVLRFHPKLPHPVGTSFPALVCRVDDVNGTFTGVWRIFLDEAGRKAPVANCKLALGRVAGGAVRLFDPVAGCIGLAEGVENALAAYEIAGGTIPVWASMSTSGMRSFMPPFEIERIVVFPDADLPKRNEHGEWSKSPGLEAANALKARMDSESVECIIADGPRDGRDYVDLLAEVERRWPNGGILEN